MKLISSVALLSAVLLGGGASAASLNFVKEAAGNERGVADGTPIVFDGLTVRFSSSHFAYFDDLSGGKPGGLGVCKVLTAGNQCSPSSDDNLTSGESVTLTFGQTVDLNGFSFTDKDHKGLNTSSKTLQIGLNGGSLASTTFAHVVGNAFTGVNSITFAYGVSNASSYYVNGMTAVQSPPPGNAPVPLPAAAPLLIAGMGALGLIKRRRNAT